MYLLIFKKKHSIIFVIDNLNHTGFVEDESCWTYDLRFSLVIDREPVIAPLDNLYEVFVFVIGFHGSYDKK